MTEKTLRIQGEGDAVREVIDLIEKLTAESRLSQWWQEDTVSVFEPAVRAEVEFRLEECPESVGAEGMSFNSAQVDYMTNAVMDTELTGFADDVISVMKVEVKKIKGQK